MKNKLTAVSFRLLLSILMFVTMSIIIAVVFFGNSQLKEYAAQVSQVTSDADASRNSLQTLQKVKQELDSQKDIVDRAASIVADSKGYQYQDQIIKDLNGYAAASGITITDFSFTTAATTPSAATPAGAPAPAGVKSTSASITLKTPINYVSLLQFIHSIEQNLTKMQISRISLSKGEKNDEIRTDGLEIQVYIN
ncbi:MAG: hypothetical protein ABIQ04_03595 [Candidatus Saccharimonadales bacterium]